MFEQVKKSGICKTGSVLKGLNVKKSLKVHFFCINDPFLEAKSTTKDIDLIK
jgi:hypothetical protein